MNVRTFPIAPVFQPIAIRRELDRLFDDVMVNRATGTWRPAADAREDATGYALDIDLPGVAPESVDVLTEDGILTVKGARASRPVAEGERALFSETGRGEFVRRFRLPKTANLQAVTASYTNGVLAVRVAKLVPAQPNKVPVTLG